MPDVSSSRYQSRLLNFVHQRIQPLGDRLQRTFRHVQVAIGWSLEALLYPVYLLFQKVFESELRQLQPEKQQPHDDIDFELVETSSFADIPIQRVLEAVENQSTVVQGIASELVSRDLVLVSYENEILKILTLQQQEKLQAQMMTEVANYWRNWRLTAEKDEPKQLREIERLLTKLISGGRKPTFSRYPALGLFDKVLSKPLPQRSPTPTLSNSELEDPWLTFNDLFDESQQIDAPGNNQQLVTPPHNPSARYSPKSLLHSYQNFFRKHKSGAALTQRQKLTDDLDRIQRRLEEITSTLELQNERSEGEISQQGRQTSQVEIKPDWIETKAKAIGYEKHPLERILAWVDGTMLFLEEMFLKIFQSLQRVFKL